MSDWGVGNPRLEGVYVKVLAFEIAQAEAERERLDLTIAYFRERLAELTAPATDPKEPTRV